MFWRAAIFTAALTNAIRSQATECKTGFTNVGGSCYKILADQPMTYHVARKACRDLSKAVGVEVDLATIRCQIENDGIIGMYKKEFVNALQAYKKTNKHVYYNTLWHGLHDIHNTTISKNKGVWFLQQTDTGYRNWCPGQPRNVHGREPVATILLEEFTTPTPAIPVRWSPGAWTDDDVRAKVFGAVCEHIVTTSGAGCKPKKVEQEVEEEDCEAEEL